ncbi:FAD-binding and (Fe-S)-binding domain-containing protein [Ulvibacterium marinum]|uniref:FAD-binding and (Fe-S)-binding domain-containing protein n=1 Tax=Ulvibacterium marinum TaxID=2419782 RepID=UPI002494FBE2|nr:FAD-binding and (Fe-S)-binding domain-containing protein [Ulvibacterium marinum]
MKAIFDSLDKSIKGEVLVDDYSLGMYATDASIYQIKPIAIVLPMDTEDVKSTVAIAQKNKISILPRGAGTSLAGQTVGRSIILDFSKYMNALLETNESEKWVRVQPGMVRDKLNAELKPYGLHFAPDPATGSRANVGGMVGNNSSGTKSILFGKTVDHVLEAAVLLVDGTILHLKNCPPEEYDEKAAKNNREGEIYTSFKRLVDAHSKEIKERFPKVMRRVGGYNLDEFVYTDQWNLSKLICGSEGTLATTLELKLNLVDLPKHKSVCVVHFAEILEAISAVESMLPFTPSAIEILDKTVIGLSRENLTTKHHCHFLEGNPEAILIVEFYGDTLEDVMERPRQMITQLKANGFGYAYPIFPEGEAYEDVWVIRKKGLGLMLGLKGNKKPLAFIEDAGIPSQHLPEYIDQVLKICKKHETEAAMYAHASVGVIHVRPILDLRLEEDIQRLKAITEDTFKLVMKYKGSWSGEHGDGLVRSAYNKRFFGETLYGAFLDIKRLFDPDNLMNPGKIIEAQTIEHNLRYGTAYQDQAIKTEYQYEVEGGFGASVHMCTGVGECRKLIGGTMCPSFKATRDEEHSTRGRANALRLAMSNQFGKEGLASQRLHEVMDLCLSCKACKSECPSNVDMAKMKSDSLQMYYDEHGISFRDRLIRDSAKSAANISGWKASMVNPLQKTALFRFILERVAKFDKRRKLPDFAELPFYKWFTKNAHKTNKGDKKVVLFADTYLNYHEPHVGISALKLLNSCGYEVILAHVGCCQRPKISHGFLRDAKRDGAKTIDGLKKFLGQGLKVVVCEPSCASALNDDLPDMIANTDTAEQLKNGVMMIDVFLSDELEKGHLNVRFEPISGAMAIHGHCHQKALYGTNAMKTLLKDSVKEIQEIPSGCCGMAGSFGYEKEHYALSEKIGNKILFPAIKNLQKDHEIVACGFSCRHQIQHFTEATPKHFVEAIRAVKNN